MIDSGPWMDPHSNPCAEHKTAVNNKPRRAVFFDVIGKTSPAPASSGLRVPNWWKRGPSRGASNTTEAASTEGPTDGTIDAPAPIVWRSDGQLIISLGQIGKIVAAATLCMLVLISFSLGRISEGQHGKTI